MVLEMKRALEDLQKGDRQGYRKLYDAVYEDTYSRSFLILQSEEAAGEFMKGFFAELFGMLDEADPAKNQEKWFWDKYYRRMRREYHKLLAADQEKKPAGSGKAGALSDIPGGFPLLHRIMLVMAYKDDFTAKEISGIFGLAEDKIQAELDKLEKILPTLAKNQPAGVSGYMGSWAVFLVGAFRQILKNASETLVDQVYEAAAGEAGITVESAVAKDDTFEYFIADPDLPEQESEKKTEPVPEPKRVRKPVPAVEEEPDDEDDEYDDEYEDDEEDDDNYEEEDDRYDWDLEDDGKKMVILGVVIALVLVAVIGFAAFRIFGGGGRDNADNTVTEQEQEDEEEGSITIYGDPKCFSQIQKHLEENGYEVVGAEFTYIPNDLKDVTPEERESIDKMVERLEEFDDVQTVYTNMKPAEGE